MPLPPYQPMLEAFHRAFAPELRAFIALLPLRAGASVLDVGCGDGTYALWLAERLGRRGRVVGVDQLPDYVQRATQRARRRSLSARVSFREGAIERLPFPDGVFDLVWCAQSLYSFPDPQAAVREMARVARAGGVVAVLEDDTLHQMVVPWPIDLELAIRTAEWEAFQRENADPKKYYIARGMRALFKKAGLRSHDTQWRMFYRENPLAAAERRFLGFYFDNLRARVQTRLNARHRRMLSAFLNKKAPTYLVRQPTFNIAYVERLTCGVKR